MTKYNDLNCNANDLPVYSVEIAVSREALAALADHMDFEGGAKDTTFANVRALVSAAQAAIAALETAFNAATGADNADLYEGDYMLQASNDSLLDYVANIISARR